MKVSAGEVFTSDVINFIINEIDKNDGQEVSFVGYVDRNSIVFDVEPLAYGNENSAPVDLMDTLQGDVLIHNHPDSEFSDDTLRASEADISLATELVNKKIGFYIIDNQCRFTNIVFKPEARYYLNDPEVKSIFEENGILSKNISNFEAREEQIHLVEGIISAINDSKVLISEAGTGTGKSLAYLIPASIWAVKNKKRVVVSTQTINLQQQIAGKDMLMVQKIIQSYLQENVYYSVLIGKGNYLCRKKLFDLIKDREKQETLFTEEEDYKIAIDIEEWSRNCEEGTIGEFGSFIKEEIWEEIACDTYGCTRRKCIFFSDCFYYKARLEAEKSNIIISNHSLSFSTIDESSHRSSLPFFSGIIFDEAHHIEDVALKSLSREFSIQGLIYNLRKLYSIKGEKAYGLMVLLEKKSNFYGYIELVEAYNELIKMIKNLLRDLTDFIFDGIEVLKQKTKESNSIGIDKDFTLTHDYNYIMEHLSILFSEIGRFSASFEYFSSRIKGISTKHEVVDIITTIGFRIMSLSESKSVFDLIFKTNKEINFVKWIEVTKKNLKFYYSPLEVGDFLANSLFSKKDFSIFTSATLMINGKFDYFKGSIGLQIATNKEKDEMNFPSPFDYKKQTEVYILEEKLDHGSVTKEKTDLVKELSLMSEGGVLILFTSYHRLNEMFSILKESLLDGGLIPLKQGEASREELLSKMAKNSNVVLFATSSFWEGIDIQGDNLRCVIIEKLPFDSPSDPIYKAKVELLESKGINPFLNYSIPRAVLRLKQGMGRLIRSKTDKGVIAIMDNRIKTQRYGSIFLNSIPPSKIICGSLNQIIREAENFFVSRF